MKKFICMILLLTLSSSSVLAQFADVTNKNISVTSDMNSQLHQSQFNFLGLDKKINFLASDSLNVISHSVWYPWEYKTILSQTFGGAFGLVLGGVIGLLPASMCNGEQCLPLMVIGLAIGSVLGLSSAVVISGNDQGGNGNFGLTLLGSLVGVASFYGLINLVHHDHINDSGYIYLLFAMTIGGAIVGYHLSASPAITTNRTSLMQFEKNQFGFNIPSMKINRYEYPTTSYGISANVFSIQF